MIKALPHQDLYSDKAVEILNKYGLCYLMFEPRVGKSYTAILTAEKMQDIRNVLILTRKKAIEGIEKFLHNVSKNYTVTNFEQSHKLNSEDYCFIIIDEASSISAFPKPSNVTKNIRKLAYDKKVLFLSGTPFIESPSQIFHQFYVTNYSPFSNYKNFYSWHKDYGIESSIFVAGRNIKQYNKCKPELLDEVDKYCLKLTQSDIGIESKAEDELHFVELSERTKKIYNTLQRKKVISVYDVNQNVVKIVCDNVIKLRMTLHMIESGCFKVDDNYYELGNTEKIDYIKKNFKETENMVIMSNFVQERELLKKHFKKARILSSISNSMGVDLSKSDSFIIYSQSYSGTHHVQLRDRIVNMNGSTSNKVHFILTKNAISHQVYIATSNKKDFNNSLYLRKDL